MKPKCHTHLCHVISNKHYMTRNINTFPEYMISKGPPVPIGASLPQAKVSNVPQR